MSRQSRKLMNQLPLLMKPNDDTPAMREIVIVHIQTFLPISCAFKKADRTFA